MKKLGIFLPTIRPHLLEKWFSSLEKSCDYPFEVIFCGPFDIPDSLASKENIKFIKSWAHPTKCAQIAARECDAELIYHTTDDVLFLPNAISQAIDLHIKNPVDIVNMRYIESAEHSNKESFPLEYWVVRGSCPVPTLPPDWLTGAHFLMLKNLFQSIGGFDCQFEYLTHAAADLMIRLQTIGCNFLHSETDVTTADWSGQSHSEDHLPIQNGQEKHDLPLFHNIWSDEFGKRTQIDLDNDKNFPEVWERRFKEKDNNYSSMIKNLI